MRKGAEDVPSFYANVTELTEQKSITILFVGLAVALSLWHEA